MKNKIPIKFFNPAKWYSENRDEVDIAMHKVLGNGDLILRKDLDDFETNMAKFLGVKYFLGLNSGTDALYLALRYLGVRSGDKVLVPAYTFVATAQVVSQLGAEPILYDIDEMPDTKGFKAIIPAHLEGDFDENVFRDLDIPIIEDACQAIGAERLGQMAGSIGIAGAFSFYPAKILGCFGDGGGLSTNDKDLYEWVREARNHFKVTNNDWGINSRLDNIQAAILNIKLKYLPETLARRREIAEYYIANLPPEICPQDSTGRVWQDFVLLVGKRRDELFNYLKENDIETLKNEYPFPVPKPLKSIEYEGSSLRIPCNETLEDQDYQSVAEKINEFYQK